MFRLCGGEADGGFGCETEELRFAVGGESEVTASGSPVPTGESNLCWAP